MTYIYLTHSNINVHKSHFLKINSNSELILSFTFMLQNQQIMVLSLWVKWFKVSVIIAHVTLLTHVEHTSPPVTHSGRWLLVEEVLELARIASHTFAVCNLIQLAAKPSREHVTIWTLVKSAYQKIFFLFLNQNICCGYSKEPSH